MGSVTNQGGIFKPITRKHSVKKNLIAVAALAFVSGAAMAQSSVTVYGNIDLGLLTQNNVKVNEGSELYNGGISPSIWGFRGSEDLGGGLKALFNLEAHFYADTGAGERPAGMGTVTLGVQYSPAVLAFAATDPRGLRENFSGLYPWAYNSGALTAGNPTNNDVGVFMQNAISYSNTIGPINLTIGYSLAEKVPTAGTGGAILALGATYSGPLTVSAAYQKTDYAGTSNELSSMYSVGAGYSMGALTGKVNYLKAREKSLAGVDLTDVGMLGLGLDWKMAANNTVMFAAYSGKDSKTVAASKTTSFVLSDEYALSKRTTLYGQVAFANADAGAGLRTSIVAGGTLADKNATLFNVGVKHSF
jgi:predicted porin